jgi:predicted tellurium resistance membrane protein TerC
MLYDIVIDWLYLLVTTFAILVCVYALHLVFFELDIPGLIVDCASKIEQYFWTSIFLVCLMAVVTFDRMENKRRHRQRNHSTVTYEQ